MKPRLDVLPLVFGSLRETAVHFGFLFPVAFLSALSVTGFGLLVLPTGGFSPTSGEPELTASLLVTLVVSIMIGTAVTGVLALAAIDALVGKRHALRDYVAQALRHIVPLLGLSILISFAAGLGFVFLILPGLYVIARFLPTTPAVVFENAGWSGLGRAQELTEGYRWPLVAAILLVGLLFAGVTIPLLPLAPSPGTSPVLAILFEGLLTGVYYTFTAIFTARVYLRLREIREGVTRADIAASFD